MSTAEKRTRLSREERHQQLLQMAWQLIREEGTDALTLGRLAEKAGVTKPVVYDHFATRSGLFAVLYQQYDQRQNALMDDALARNENSLQARAQVIAGAYVDCVQQQGREIPGVIAALAGTPELEQVKRDYETDFIAKCRALLAPFATHGTLADAPLWAMLGAAESLSRAAASGAISAGQAKDELYGIIVSMVKRSA
ncbi:TetR/AcrR family transcriptional regulator [Erwinia sp. V71]|uniref:TetR/AcrR family transcriptional regulator n=1 Tax=Erwinia sp. V71 TaxID=3369424 RepID=UPI003F6232DA